MLVYSGALGGYLCARHWGGARAENNWAGVDNDVRAASIKIHSSVRDFRIKSNRF